MFFTHWLQPFMLIVFSKERNGTEFVISYR